MGGIKQGNFNYLGLGRNRYILSYIHIFIAVLRFCFSLVPRLSPRANKNQKEKREPGKIYHVRNVISRENLNTCGQTNKLAHAVWTDTVVQL